MLKIINNKNKKKRKEKKKGPGIYTLFKCGSISDDSHKHKVRGARAAAAEGKESKKKKGTHAKIALTVTHNAILKSWITQELVYFDNTKPSLFKMYASIISYLWDSHVKVILQ